MRHKLNEKHLHHGCSDCAGSGEGRADGTTCRECKGLGVIEEECIEDCWNCQHGDYCSNYDEPYLSVYEIADMCDTSAPTVYAWIAKGLIHKMENVTGRKPRKVCLLSDVEKFRNLGVHDV
jgi:hypothetical protein